MQQLFGSFANASGTQSLALGSGTGTNHTAAGASSITLGVNVQTGSSASNAISMGRNMTNGTANSLMIGFSPSLGSTVPSIFVGPAASGSVGGKIGLGTSSPSTALHVIGDATISGLGGSGSRAVLVDNSGKLVGGGITWNLGGNAVTVPTNAGTEYFGTSSNSDLYINTNATTKMLIKTTGWVGIGTTTPSSNFNSMLEVKASGGSTLSITGDAGGDIVSSGSLRPHFASGTDFSVYEGYPGTGTSTLRMILKDGKMGIGVSVPSSTLHVGGDATINNLAGGGTRSVLVDNNGKLVWGSTTTTNTTPWAMGGNSISSPGNPATEYIGTSGNSDLFFNTNSTTKMTVKSNGNVLIGNALSDVYSKLSINSNTKGAYISVTNSLTDIYEPYVLKLEAIGSNYTDLIQAYSSFGTPQKVFQVKYNGETHIGEQDQMPKTQYSTNAKLVVGGRILAQAMRVTITNWADYVFEENYELPTLKILESYIQINKHLPEVPTSQEVLVDGIDLGEMNKILLKKLEENTLYIIQLNKRIESLEKEVQSRKD